MAIACGVPYMFEEVDKKPPILPCPLVTCMCWIGFDELNDVLLEALVQLNFYQQVMQLTKEF